MRARTNGSTGAGRSGREPLALIDPPAQSSHRNWIPDNTYRKGLDVVRTPTAAIPRQDRRPSRDANAEVSAAVGVRPGPDQERSGGSEARVRNRWASVRGFVRPGRGLISAKAIVCGSDHSSRRATIARRRRRCRRHRDARCVAIFGIPCSAQLRQVDVALEMRLTQVERRFTTEHVGSHPWTRCWSTSEAIVPSGGCFREIRAAAATGISATAGPADVADVSG